MHREHCSNAQVIVKKVIQSANFYRAHAEECGQGHHSSNKCVCTDLSIPSALSYYILSTDTSCIGSTAVMRKLLSKTLSKARTFTEHTVAQAPMGATPATSAFALP